ncbi:hypothetical protein BDW02DRAFT_574522 [Decorospora gaudefroyi]|uniref:BTB domain-containing protein n=1 Tax=Decorospora gaudefroyi TaxID=184978 RepID=A0A6A5JXP0_9PLEO|nr:hypothetical protein BDW02DRAFT_574522 [Decorospora gaudefroyi]
MAKKKSSRTVAPCRGETTMFPDQPTENNVDAGEEVVVADNLTTAPGTSAVEAADPKPNESTISPYACSPVAMDFGPGLATYWVPKHLLRSPKWSTTDAGGTLCLPGVSAATGHTLVHYLYTGTYQTLEARAEDVATPAHIKLKQAVLTFGVASAYELHDLERLAKEQIEIYGSRMDLADVLDTVRKEFSKWAWSWFHEYLQVRAKEQFDLDHTFFTSKAYVENVGEDTLQRFMTSYLLETFSEKLTYTLQKREGRCLDREKPDAVSDEDDAAVKTHRCPCCHVGRQTGMYAVSDERSFEFPNVSCEEVDDVISVENLVGDGIPPTSPELEPVPPPEPEPPAESEPEPVPVSESVEEVEEAERKKKEEEVEEAAATSALADLSWKGPAAANDGWGSFARTVGKKKKGKKGKAEVTLLPLSPPAEPPTTFDDGWGFGATTTKSKKKGNKGKAKQEVEESPPPPPEPEPLIELEPTAPVEEKPADPWADWGGGPVWPKKSKKSKGVVALDLEPEPIVVHEPVPDLEPTTAEDNNGGGDWGFVSIWGGSKKKKKAKIEAAVEEPDGADEPAAEQEELRKPEQEHTSSMLCPRRSHHLLEGDGWKSCERCCAMLREIAGQLAKENKTVLLLG